MAFFYETSELPVSFKTLTHLKNHISATEKSIEKISLKELLRDNASFFDDSKFGTKNHNFGFTEYSYKALCQYFSFPLALIEGITQEGLASTLLNDFMTNNKGRQNTDNVYFIVDEQQKKILGIVTGSYVYYTNTEFIDAIEEILGSSEAQENELIIDSAHYYHTRLYVRLITRIEAGVATGKGGTKKDLTKIGLQLTNSMVGDLPVRVAYFLYRMLCANGMIARTKDIVAMVKHSGYRESFDYRLGKRVIALLQEVQMVRDLLNGLGEIPFVPQKLVKVGLGSAVLDTIPEMRSTLRKNVSLDGEDEIEDPKKRKIWRQTTYIDAIPRVYGREHSLRVFNSSWRDNASMFDFINVLTEYAKELPIMTRLQVEENVGEIADLVLKNKAKLMK
ncbi:hypothetical protein [Trichlorobacter lovleyi]|uniref:hypothetical protein n=1 Tax=Trichlorobacter lovleyi TaxID=313985 RepID=UPI00247FF0E6|nr:hypothetical protein [Trichlorobacter lovleyi]